MIFSSDSGKTWDTLQLPHHHTWLSGVDNSPGGSAYLVGDRGKIIVSINKGQNWMSYTQLGK
jgi:hypothetical protein